MSKKLSSQFENNRQCILKTASKLFYEKGISATSFSDISKAVKLSKGTIYYYYPSKDHLIFEVTEYHLNQISNRIFAWIDTINSQTAIQDSLIMLIQSVFDTVDKCRLHICLLSYSIMGNDLIQNTIKEMISKWHTMVEIGLVKIGCANPKRIAQAVFLSLDSIIINRIMGTMDMSEQDIGAYIALNV
ncbi:MAG: TetR/AcrR family transcriptional regulator [Christensenellales bacterium]